MSQAPFPGHGQHDGEQPPLPGDETWDAGADLARFLAEVDGGRIPVPAEDMTAPAVLFSLGEAADVDPVVLAVMAGPDGLGGEAFDRGKAANALRPGPLLAALTEQAATDVPALGDDALMGVISAARRLQNRAGYLELAGIAEFARRRAAEAEAARARKVPAGCRPGEFADAELGMELLISPRTAGDRMDFAAALATRLPCTFAGLAAGTIDEARAGVIAYYTRCLSDEHAAHADAVLAAVAPGLRYEQLARKAAALENKLDPAGVKRRKEEARKQGQRVEARREASGNMSYGGRELATADVLAAKAVIDADAIALRNAGVPGSLHQLRALAFMDRLHGRDPMDRARPIPDTAEPASAADAAGRAGQHGDTASKPRAADGRNTARMPGDSDEDDSYRGGEPWSHDDEDEDDEGGSPRGPQGPGTPVGGLAPLPALINLVVPAGTYLGWSNAPGEAGGWGLLDAADTRDLVQAASRHPRSRWCVTVTGPDGSAIAHGCARGQHPVHPPDPVRPPDPVSRDGPGPNPQQAAQLADLLRRLNVTLAPIAQGSCDHRHAEDRYTPSRKLKHLVRARTARCTAPGCDAQAYYCDIDHTRPYPDGITCECGLGPVCRRHHRCKQAPGWRLAQPAPGVMRWTTPSGRVYTTRPTVYDS